MEREHDKLQQMICSLSEIGVNISKTKSRLELGEIMKDCEYRRKQQNFET